MSSIIFQCSKKVKNIKIANTKLKLQWKKKGCNLNAIIMCLTIKTICN